MSDRFARLGALMARRRKLVALLWLLIVVAAGAYAPHAQKVLQAGGFNVPESQSQLVNDALDKEFHNSTLTTAVVVYKAGDKTVDDKDVQRKAQAADDKLAKVSGVVSVRSYFDNGDPTLVSKDHKTALALVALSGGDSAAQNKVPALRDALTDSDLDLLVTGFPAVQNDTYALSQEDLVKTEAITLPIVAICLLLFFGTVVAAAIPLVLGIAAVVISTGLIGALGDHFSISIFALNIGSLIGLGLAIDFSLIMVRRFREERAAGRDVHEAVAATTATAGRSILFSGVMLVTSMFAVTAVFYDLMIVRSISLGVAVVSTIGLLAGVTLLPAVLAMLGDKVDKLRVIPRRKPRPADSGAWYKLSVSIMKRPVAWLLVSLIILGVLAVPLLHIRMVGANTAALPSSTESVKGAKDVEKAFGDNALNPITITVKNPAGKDGAFDPKFLAALRKLSNTLYMDPRTDMVGSLSMMLAAVPDDRFVKVRRDYFTDVPPLDPDKAPAVPGVDIEPLIYAPTDLKVVVPAYVGIGEFTFPAGYKQPATSIQGQTALRLVDGDLTVASNGASHYAAGSKDGKPMTGAATKLKPGEQVVVPPDVAISFTAGAKPAHFMAVTMFVIRGSADPQTSWLQGQPSLDLFAGAKRNVISGGVMTGLPQKNVVMELDRVTVAPGALIPRHVHPGPEVMAGAEGTLTIYAAPPDEMTMTRSNGRGRVEIFDTALKISRGDHAVVQMGKVHRAQNLTDKPAVVYSARVWQEPGPGTLPAAPTQVANRFVNLDGKGDTALVTVLPKAGQYDDEHQAYVKDIRDRIIPELKDLDGYEVSVGGDAAAFVDFKGALYGRFPIVALSVGALILVLLLLFFRSVLLPIKAAILSLLPLVATYGVLVWLFQDGHGEKVLNFESQGLLNVVTPAIVFMILFGLSSDYEVFMLSRVREHFDRTGDTVKSVALGLQQTAGLITAAGLILIATFGSLAASSVETLKEIGVGLAVGVFLDATIVRLIMVPATMVLMRNANWWLPAWLRDRLPAVNHGEPATAELDEDLDPKADAVPVGSPS